MEDWLSTVYEIYFNLKLKAIKLQSDIVKNRDEETKSPLPFIGNLESSFSFPS